MTDARPRVLHIITRLEPGGSSRNTVDSCAAQAGDYDVTLISGPHPDSAALIGLMPTEVKYIEIPDLQREICAAKDRRAMMAIKRELAALRPDIVHTHTSKAGALGRLAAALYNLKAERRALVVHTPHGHLLYGYYGALRTLVFKLAERFLARFTDYFIALTPGEMDESSAAGIGTPGQWRVIHSGVDFAPPAAPSNKSALGISGEKTTIGTIARLEPVKGVEYLLRAAALIKTRFPEIPFKAVVIGGGALEENLRRLAEELGIADQVLFTGFRHDAAGLLPALDIYVQPSLNEAMGRAPLEAQALGIPAVVSSVCGLPAVIREGETGYAVPPADPAALAEAVSKLLLSPELRAGMGAAARDWALAKDETGCPRFGAESMNIRLKKFYNEILGDQRVGGLP